jgi:hypothetical protein
LPPIANAVDINVCPSFNQVALNQPFFMVSSLLVQKILFPFPKAILPDGRPYVFQKAHIMPDVMDGIQYHSQYLTGNIKVP